MYKEIAIRKKVSTIFIILIMLSISIVVSDVISTLTYDEYEVGKYLGIIVAIFALTFSINQVEKCKVKYKYSIIVDEFIIHRVKGNRHEIMECVKIKDIKCIKKEGKSKAFLDTISSKVYGCLNFDKDLYLCKYNDGRVNKSFYFEASHRLINKLYSTKDKEQMKNAG
ncbi:hypothetical protein RBU49_14120 [Clostridium sp. MB40-C1]|uniref:hypothetical protein n=1 Tax=Clostridium sp. MB40-C1 TaxID=3070996 RepID=UPI0027E20ABE|nr:hypothetical protein [Clostridium sp. MB40-C1]WMJ79994.1 hypothetical protein RBU49_14120 [Clostridium sp. MB40-C1]